MQSCVHERNGPTNEIRGCNFRVMQVLFRTALEIVEVVHECFSQALVNGNSKNTNNNPKDSAIAWAHRPLRVATLRGSG